MLKLISATALTALLGYASCLYGPWWSFVLSSIIVAVTIHMKPMKAFLGGFLGLFLLWFALALWIDNGNQHNLSTKIAEILPLGGSSMVLIFITAFVGAIISGFAALTGSFGRTLFFSTGQ
jgi:hypothetical protein